MQNSAPRTVEEKLQRLASDPSWSTIVVRLPDAPHVTEELLVEAVSPGRYRLAANPGMIEGFAADDIVAVDLSSSPQLSLVSRGKNVAVKVWCPESIDSIRDILTARLSALGGWLDATMGQRGLCFAVPVSAGFQAIEAAVNEAMRGSSDATWYYANVFDPATGAPLNWWSSHLGGSTLRA